MKSLFIISFLFIAIYQFAEGQNRKLTDDEINSSTVTKLKFADTINCAEIDGWIKSDIKKHTIFLFLQGGIAPVIYSKDAIFENTYGVYFYDFGCISPDYKCVIKYNERVFEYLTDTYGKKWTKKIRKDIIGFSQWIEKRQ